MSTDLVPATGASLDADPVEYMALALNRAKGWLAEARSIEEVREEKALAVGYESVIREKELAFDAQLSATEIVRRCERRIGELVREGQRNGTIAKRGDVGAKPAPGVRGGHPGTNRGEHLDSSADFFDHEGERADSYAMAGAPAEQFEQAIAEARAEGRLSRRHVVGKVKGGKPKAERSEWHRKRRHIDSNRILTTLADELDAATAGLELMERDDLDPETVAERVPAIRESIGTINKHLRRIQ